jgi:AhpD family alkylhydroperoxidase
VAVFFTKEHSVATGAKEFFENNNAAMKPVKASMPEVLRGFGGLHQAVMKPGALSVMEKELMAMAIGLAMRCENCIYTHVQAAVNAGATREQVLEAAGVAVLMQGGPSYTYLPRVTEALDALAPKPTP